MSEYPLDEKTRQRRLLCDHEVVREEHQIISARRKIRLGYSRAVSNTDLAEEPENYLKRGRFDTNGLSLSGGGIRSAAYCLGAMQGLARHGLMQHFDYLSTVSGGGYIGTSASLHMPDDGKSFPFFKLNEFKDTEIVKDLRDKTNYLRVGEFKATLSNIAIYLRGLVANMATILSGLLLLAALTLFCNPDWRAMTTPDFLGIPLPSYVKQWSTFGITPSLLLVSLVIFWFWSLNVENTIAAGLKSPVLKIVRWLPVIVLVTAFFELQPLILKSLATNVVGKSGPMLPQPQQIQLWDIGFSKIKNAIAVLTPVLTGFAVFAKGIGNMLKNGDGQSSFLDKLIQYTGRTLVWVAAGLLLPLLLWSCYLLLVIWALGPGDTSLNEKASASILNQPTFQYAVAGLLLYFFQVFSRPNSNSPHRLYRDRLARAFYPPAAHSSTGDQRSFLLSKLDGNGPYNLINTTLNVQADKAVNRRGRNGEFFLFSPAHVGSVATGYAKTCDVEQKVDRELDVATAMAISGAAVSANMGAESIKPLRFTLAIFNVRLGYWMENVRQLIGESKRSFLPYFLRDVTGQLTSTKKLLYLTDGGHIENLGIYELLRRRCKLIVAIDAEADPEMNFGALVKLQRYARIDLGVRIDIKWSEIRRQSLDIQKNKGQAQLGPHCAVGQIMYENGDPGVLLYVKSSVSGDENDYIKDYNRRMKDYPHETTADQFFSEEQFEVYRALGFHAVNGFLDGSHMAQVTWPKTPETEPPHLEKLYDENAKGFGFSELRQLLGKTAKPSLATANPAPAAAAVKQPTRRAAGAKQLKRRNPRRLPRSI